MQNSSDRQPFLLGITGPSSSGKTYLSNEILKKAKFEGVDHVYISTDEFYRDLSHLSPEARKLVNYDEPSSIDEVEFIEALNQLKAGQSVEVPIYDFSAHNRTAEKRTVRPAGLVIVEGIFTLAFDEIVELFDFSIYVELASDLRVLRRIRRDINERGRSLNSIIDQYHTTVRPTQNKYVEADRSKADVIVIGDKTTYPVIDLIFSKVKK